jgi:2-polyprenyl-3-methyl-5-hydroxy-6-metoxy-1,4-benzoquinol methylase
VVRPSPANNHEAYAQRLTRLQGRWWKRLLDVQRPYRWYLRQLNLGFVLDVGCGIGRSLSNAGGHGVGVDVNPFAVGQCRAKGLEAFTAEEFKQTTWAKPASFDALLVAHVVEHMTFAEAVGLLRTYLPLLKPGGRVVLITPQERGFASDPTHIEPFDFKVLERLARECGIEVVKRESFPLPRLFGLVFPHNEFIVVGKLPTTTAVVT